MNQREQFEAWAVLHGMSIAVRNSSHKQYVRTTTNYAWMAWQAAQAQQPATTALTLDGQSPEEFIGARLYDFQQATGCDTAEQYLKTQATTAQEPVARVSGWYSGYQCIAALKSAVLPVGMALYSAAPQRKLTDEQIENLHWGEMSNRDLSFARAVEAAITNGGE